MGTYLTLIALLVLVLFPLLIPLAVTLAPPAVTGLRRVRRGIANGREIAARLIDQQRRATSASDNFPVGDVVALRRVP
jgi:hypothetical protein